MGSTSNTTAIGQYLSMGELAGAVGVAVELNDEVLNIGGLTQALALNTSFCGFWVSAHLSAL